jgi:hypothetical protein
VKLTTTHQPKVLSSVWSLIAICSVLVGISATPAHSVAADKLTPEELLAKHLASVGSADALAAAHSRIVAGTVQARFRLTNTPVELSGPAELASDGKRVLLAMTFNSTNYPHEKAGYDGDKVTVGILTQGGRSLLGNFLTSQPVLLKQGLLGGVLSTAWPLFNLDSSNVKLSYAGTDKINGQLVHKLKYTPRNAGSLGITLYFNADTFQHVRSQYEYVIAARQGTTAEASISQRDSRLRLVEDFSDFQTTGGLTLPHVYKLQLTIDATRTQTMEWTINLAQFAFNQQIEPESFNAAKN